MASLGYIQSDAVVATRPAGAIHPRIEIRDHLCVMAAQLKRVFPLSNPDQFVCIQDGAGKEVAILRHVEGLEDHTAAIFAEELDRRYFTPMIERIRELNQEAGMWHFSVDTQRGPTEFYVRNWRDSAHEISPGRWQIYSVDGGRFDIPNTEALDERSRWHMARLI